MLRKVNKYQFLGEEVETSVHRMKRLVKLLQIFIPPVIDAKRILALILLYPHSNNSALSGDPVDNTCLSEVKA